MLSLLDFARDAGFPASPVPLRDLTTKFGVDNVRDAIATHRINDTYRRCGGSASQLGSPLTGTSRRPDGSYVREFSLSTLELRNIEEPPIARDLIQATVEIAAVKCFGTEDPSDVDEPYVVVSVVSVDPHQLGQSGGAVTMRTEIINGVTPGRVFLEGRAVTERPIPVTGSGLHILVSLYEHENGDPNKIRDSIAAVIEDAAKKGAQAIVDAASGGDPKLNGPVGDFFDFEVGGVKPFKLLTVGLADVVADILGDDFVDTKTFILNEGDLLSIEKGPNSKFRKGELPAQDQFNVPTPIQEPDSLLSGGGGSYKVYFRVRVLRIPKPVEPPAVVA